MTELVVVDDGPTAVSVTMPSTQKSSSGRKHESFKEKNTNHAEMGAKHSHDVIDVCVTQEEKKQDIDDAPGGVKQLIEDTQEERKQNNRVQETQHDNDRNENKHVLTQGTPGAEITPSLENTKKRQQNVENFQRMKKKRKSNNTMRNTRAPALNHEAVQQFVNRKKTFFHKSYNNTIVPYLLPLDLMDLMCFCGRVFEQNSGTAL